jgi:hypothetical protein
LPGGFRLLPALLVLAIEKAEIAGALRLAQPRAEPLDQRFGPLHCLIVRDDPDAERASRGDHVATASMPNTILLNCQLTPTWPPPMTPWMVPKSIVESLVK